MAAKFKYLGGYPGHTKSKWGTFSSQNEGIVFVKAGGDLHFPYKTIVNIQMEQASNPNMSALLGVGFVGLAWKNKVLVVNFIYEDRIPCNAAFQEKSAELTGQIGRAYNKLTDGWHQYLSQTGSGPATLPPGGGVAAIQGGPIPDNDVKKCPYCAETIKAEAVICRYCSRDLVQEVKTNNVSQTHVITHDIVINGQYAFVKGEHVEIETVNPDPNRPHYKYVVLSKSLNQRFRLSDTDLSAG